MPLGPGYAPVSTLQGEVGVSGMVARDIKIKLGYQKYLIDCENELLHEIYEDVMQSKADDWSRTVSEYCGRLELEKGDLKKISNSELKSKIMRWDTERWRSDKESKTLPCSLAVYNRLKK